MGGGRINGHSMAGSGSGFGKSGEGATE